MKVIIKIGVRKAIYIFKYMKLIETKREETKGKTLTSNKSHEQSSIH